MFNARRWPCKPASGRRPQHSWLCCACIVQAQCGGLPVAGHNASRAELPIAKHLWAGPCTHPYHTLAVLCSPYAIHLHAGPCSPLALHLQSHAPLMRYTCRVVFPLRHTLAEPFSPHTTHLQGGVPLHHTLAGPCPPYATHLQGRVPLIPHTCRAVFPLCHTLTGPLCHSLAGPCSPCQTLAGAWSPYAIHSQGCVPALSHALAGPCSPYATHSQVCVSPYIPHSRRANLPMQLPEQGEAFIYLFPSSGISKGIRFPQRKEVD